MSKFAVHVHIHCQEHLTAWVRHSVEPQHSVNSVSSVNSSQHVECTSSNVIPLLPCCTWLVQHAPPAAAAAAAECGASLAQTWVVVPHPFGVRSHGQVVMLVSFSDAASCCCLTRACLGIRILRTRERTLIRVKCSIGSGIATTDYSPGRRHTYMREAATWDQTCGVCLRPVAAVAPELKRAGVVASAAGAAASAMRCC